MAPFCFFDSSKSLDAMLGSGESGSILTRASFIISKGMPFSLTNSELCVFKISDTLGSVIFRLPSD